jgi:hypothetical protein
MVKDSSSNVLWHPSCPPSQKQQEILQCLGADGIHPAETYFCMACLDTIQWTFQEQVEAVSEVLRGLSYSN